MFGMSEDSKELKNAVCSVGCDGSDFRDWLKMYDRIVKQYPSVAAEYRRAKQNTVSVQSSARHLEEILKNKTQDDISRKEFAEELKELKRLKDGVSHEFLVSKADREFFSTYETILRLGAACQSGKGNRLILQSEVENLLALLAENLEKKEPNLVALAVFYQDHKDAELTELPASERLNRITDLYRRKFVAPIREILTEAVENADKKSMALEADGGKKALKQLEELALFRNAVGRTVEERVESIVTELCNI